jgi:hypothetical protein
VSGAGDETQTCTGQRRRRRSASPMAVHDRVSVTVRGAGTKVSLNHDSGAASSGVPLQGCLSKAMRRAEGAPCLALPHGLCRAGGKRHPGLLGTPGRNVRR